jgi:hypothetical protein
LSSDRQACIGGTRILYCAPANFNYRNNLNHEKLPKLALGTSLDLTIVESPAELLVLLLPRFPGQPGALVARMAEAMTRRLIEAGASEDVCELFAALNTQRLGTS